MYFKKIFMDENGSMTYLVGCPAEKVACVVDPKKGSVQEYIETAIKYGMKITHVFDTHALEDPLNGNMELQSRTGGTLRMTRLGAVWPIREGLFFSRLSLSLLMNSGLLQVASGM